MSLQAMRNLKGYRMVLTVTVRLLQTYQRNSWWGGVAQKMFVKTAVRSTYQKNEYS